MEFDKEYKALFSSSLETDESWKTKELRAMKEKSHLSLLGGLPVKAVPSDDLLDEDDLYTSFTQIDIPPANPPLPVTPKPLPIIDTPIEYPIPSKVQQILKKVKESEDTYFKGVSKPDISPLTEDKAVIETDSQQGGHNEPVIERNERFKYISVTENGFRFIYEYGGSRRIYYKHAASSVFKWTFNLTEINHYDLLTGDAGLERVLSRESPLYAPRIRQIYDKFYRSGLMGPASDEKLHTISAGALSDLVSMGRAYLNAKYGGSQKQRFSNIHQGQFNKLSAIALSTLGIYDKGILVQVSDSDLKTLKMVTIGDEIAEKDLKPGECYYIDNGQDIFIYRFLSRRQDGILLFSTGRKGSGLIKLTGNKYYTVNATI